jgi:hypothetical protein
VVSVKQTFYTLSADLALLVSAFFTVHWFQYGNLLVSQTNWDVLKLQAVVWLCVALITGKCRRIFSLAPARGAEM